MDRQAKVLDRLVSRRQESIKAIRHSVLLREGYSLHQEKGLSGEWYRKTKDGAGRTRPQIPSMIMVPDDEEVENMLPRHLKRTAVDAYLKKFIMIQKQVKEKLEQHNTRLGRRHVQLRVLRMQRSRLQYGGVGRPQRIVADEDEGITGARAGQIIYSNAMIDNNHEHIDIPWQTLLEQPGQNLGLREVNLDMGKNDVRFMVLREYIFSDILP